METFCEITFTGLTVANLFLRSLSYSQKTKEEDRAIGQLLTILAFFVSLLVAYGAGLYD